MFGNSITGELVNYRGDYSNHQFFVELIVRKLCQNDAFGNGCCFFLGTLFTCALESVVYICTVASPAALLGCTQVYLFTHLPHESRLANAQELTLEE